MAKRPTPPPLELANLTPEQKRFAIQKIQRRLPELEEFDPKSVKDRSDPKVKVLQQKLEDLIASIYPPGTIEYRRYQLPVARLDRGPMVMGGTPIHRVIEGLEQGKQTSIETLRGIMDLLSEDLEDEADRNQPDPVLQAYAELDLHPEIDRAASALYHDGHFSNAIEDAVKALNAFVRLRSGVDDKDGTNLMEFVFSPKSPILRFNDLADDSDRNEQKGFMMMMSGAVAGLRNPRAHTIIKDDPERALEFIAFISLLAKLVDQAKKA